MIFLGRLSFGLGFEDLKSIGFEDTGDTNND